jgi:sulfatase modifying factor 1
MRTLLIACLSALLLSSAFTAKKKDKLKLPAEYVRIPGGTYYSDNTGDHGETAKYRKTITGFYMSRNEISNIQYRQFFDEVSIGMTADERNKIQCDSSGWKKGPLRYCEPFSSLSTYHRHPAYNNFPVVNISYEGAMKYCEWLQEKMQKDNPGFVISVQLPAKDQWTWASMGGRSQAIYPWANYYLQNKKGKDLCNYKKVGEQAITRNKETGIPQITKDAFRNNRYLMPVKSFSANDFGLYNMSGNAAEMISERGICMGGSWDDYGGDVTIRSEANYNEPGPTIGFRPIIIANEKK